MKFLFSLLLLLLMSCWKTKNQATNECFANQVGSYRLDIERTLRRAGNIGSYVKDLKRWKNFEITFLADSTFHTNMQVDFLQTLRVPGNRVSAVSKAPD